MTPKQQACGTWPSPISSERINLEVKTLDDAIVDAATSSIYHIVNAGVKAGQSVLIDSVSGIEVVGAPFNVKTVVNSYGRGAAAIANGILYFNNLEDNRIYRKILPDGEPTPVSPDSRDYYFAEIRIHPQHLELLVCIMEDQSCGFPSEAPTSLVCIDTHTWVMTTVVSGADFYINPILSVDGTKLAWIQWNHPHMQWHASQLFLADISIQQKPDAGVLSLHVTNTKLIAGDPGSNAVFQAHWLSLPSGPSKLLFTWDKGEQCEPWIWSQHDLALHYLLPRPHHIAGDFSLPVWWLDDSYFAVLSDEICICTVISRGICSLNVLHLKTGYISPILSVYVTISRLRRVDATTVVFVGTTPERDAEIIRATFNHSSWEYPIFESLASADPNPLDPAYVSSGAAFTINKLNGQLTYANFYLPRHPDYIPLANEKPPCILSLHSGPTYHSTLSFTWYRQYYTTRGFAWLDVEYSGSSGFGKDYRQRLDGQYGVIEVEDVVEAADYVGSLDYFDRKRTVLRSSSGGTLSQMQTFVMHPDAFAGAMAFMILADPAKLVPGPTKFTKWYGVKLVGGTPQEIPEVYKERAPINRAYRITRPLLLIHVAASPSYYQALEMAEAVIKHGGSAELLTLPQIDSDAFKTLYERELKFYQRILVNV